jgi:hypothetical protein
MGKDCLDRCHINLVAGGTEISRKTVILTHSKCPFRNGAPPGLEPGQAV